MDLVVIKHPRVYPRHWVFHALKRLFNITLIVFSLPFLLPVLAVCALVISIDSKGPVLFIQNRIGKGGKCFRLYKFRTMPQEPDDQKHKALMKSYIKGEVDCDENGKEIYKPVQTLKITRVGRILRKTSLDELPQLINVLRGEMSIVGPRPNVIWEVEEYKSWHHERLEVLPGITGLAQIRGRSCIDFNSLVRYDIEHVEKQSFLLDFKILAMTIITVIQAKGAL